jgi:hypothetical protein
MNRVCDPQRRQHRRCGCSMRVVTNAHFSAAAPSLLMLMPMRELNGNFDADAPLGNSRSRDNFSNRFLRVDCQSSHRTLHSQSRIQSTAKRLAMSAPPQVFQLAQVPLSCHSFNASHDREYPSQGHNPFLMAYFPAQVWP